MTWVLWDILIPLIASFALGIILGWLIWRHRSRHSNRQVTHQYNPEEQVAEDTSAVSPEATSVAIDATEPDLVEHGAVAEPQPSQQSAIINIEAVNSVLIRERDEANDALEDLQVEADAMRERIAELESDTSKADILQSDEAMDESGISRDATSLLLQNNDTELVKEKEQLKLQHDELTESLEREKQSRRALELELLNIKNRHGKAAMDATSSISTEEHTNALEERDETIQSLQQQLNYQTTQHLNYKQTAESLVKEHEYSDEGSVAEEDLAVEVSDPAVEAFDQIDIRNTKEEVAEPNVQQPMHSQHNSGQHNSGQNNPGQNNLGQNDPGQNDYVPQGWTVPLETPAAKECDKLTRIKGVGPVLEKMLHECGIYFYHQIANLDNDGMAELQAQISQFPGRIERDDWVAQAKELHLKKQAETA